MIEFGSFNILVREAVNGAMALSALLLITIFARFCWRNRVAYWKGILTVQERREYHAAAAIAVLTAGHFFRAASSWIEFILVDIGMNASNWVKWTWILFLASAALIIGGKAMMFSQFASQSWRRPILLVWLPLCVIIPIIVAILLGMVRPAGDD